MDANFSYVRMDLVQAAPAESPPMSPGRPPSAPLPPDKKMLHAAADGDGGAQQDDHDVVQFTAMHYFVKESEGQVSIDLMRIGRLEESCTVSYRTVDGSAEDGKRYVGVSG